MWRRGLQQPVWGYGKPVVPSSSSPLLLGIETEQARVEGEGGGREREREKEPERDCVWLVAGSDLQLWRIRPPGYWLSLPTHTIVQSWRTLSLHTQKVQSWVLTDTLPTHTNSAVLTETLPTQCTHTNSAALKDSLPTHTNIVGLSPYTQKV